MNIFVLDKDPVLAAQYHNDKHVVKMILESCQLLSACHHVFFNTRMTDKQRDQHRGFIESLPKLTHENHPCNIWLRKSPSNYRWLYRLFKALCQEYTYRYERTHEYWKLYGKKLQVLPEYPYSKSTMTPFEQVMPDEYKVMVGEKDVSSFKEAAVKAYRRYYLAEKKKFSVFTKRGKPEWWV